VPPGGCGIPNNGEIALSHCHILYDATNIYLVGGFNHLEEYESQWEGLFPYIMEKYKNVPNHQPVLYDATNIYASYIASPDSHLVQLVRSERPQPTQFSRA